MTGLSSPNTPITLDMAMFKNNSGQITQSMLDVVNKSPTLVAQLNQYNNDVVAGYKIDPATGGQWINPSTGLGVKIDPIQFTANPNLSSAAYAQTGANEYGLVFSTNASFFAGSSPDPVGYFVGYLAHEVGHYINGDNDLASEQSLAGQLSSYNLTDSQKIKTMAGLSMSEEAEGIVNNYNIYKELKGQGVTIQVPGSAQASGSTMLDALQAVDSQSSGNASAIASCAATYNANYNVAANGAPYFSQAEQQWAPILLRNGLITNSTINSSDAPVTTALSGVNGFTVGSGINGSCTPASTSSYSTNVNTGATSVDTKNLNNDGSVKNEVDTSVTKYGVVDVYATGQGASINQSNATITLTNGATATVSGSGDTINTGASGNLNVSGGNDTVNLGGASSQLDLLSGSGYSVNATGAAISTGGNTSFNLSGGNDTVSLGGINNYVGLLGGSGYAVSGTQSTISTWANTGLSVYGGNDNVNLFGTGSNLMLEGNTGYTVNATDSTISTWDHTGLFLSGGNDVVNFNGVGSNVDLEGGSGYLVNGTNNAIETWNDTGLSVSGGDDSVNVGSGSTLMLEGNVGYAVTGSASTISSWDHTGFTLAGGGDTVNLIGNGSNVDVLGGSGYSVNGSNDTVSTSGNTSLNLAGGNDTVDFGGTNNYVGLLGGSGYAVNGTESTISTWNNTGLSVYGGHDSVNIGTGSNLTLEGNVGYAVTGSSSTISTWDHTDFSLAGGGDTVDLNGNGSVADLVGGTGYAIYGSNDTIYGFHPGVDSLYGTGDGYYDNTESGVDYGASSDTGGSSGDTGGGGSTDPVDDNPDAGGDCVDGDPIVVNLQGQTVQTVGVANSPASFDWQGNGQAARTGWGTAGEGYLVYDPNDPDNTAAITQDSQLVGGFGALQSLASQVDGTGSGTLSASDTLWKDLKVWVDFTGTGQFQSGDLYSLDQLGITGINLNATVVNLNSNGNTILDDSSFTMATGATGDMAGVNLQYVSAGATASQVSSSNADQLVQAMASFAPDTAGAALTFDPSQLNPTAPLLAAAH